MLPKRSSFFVRCLANGDYVLISNVASCGLVTVHDGDAAIANLQNTIHRRPRIVKVGLKTSGIVLLLQEAGRLLPLKRHHSRDTLGLKKRSKLLLWPLASFFSVFLPSDRQRTCCCCCLRLLSSLYNLNLMAATRFAMPSS